MQRSPDLHACCRLDVGSGTVPVELNYCRRPVYRRYTVRRGTGQSAFCCNSFHGDADWRDRPRRLNYAVSESAAHQYRTWRGSGLRRAAGLHDGRSYIYIYIYISAALSISTTSVQWSSAWLTYWRHNKRWMYLFPRAVRIQRINGRYTDSLLPRSCSSHKKTLGRLRLIHAATACPCLLAH